MSLKKWKRRTNLTNMETKCQTHNSKINDNRESKISGMFISNYSSTNHSVPLSVALKKQHAFINLECNFFPVKKSVVQHFFRSIHITEHTFPSAGGLMRVETSTMLQKIPSLSISEHVHALKLLIMVCTVIQRENSGKLLQDTF